MRDPRKLALKLVLRKEIGSGDVYFILLYSTRFAACPPILEVCSE